jgi:hypothetical protein
MRKAFASAGEMCAGRPRGDLFVGLGSGRMPAEAIAIA